MIWKSLHDALNSINQNISIGTILLMDDYNSFNVDNNKGQRKVFSYQEKSEYILKSFLTTRLCAFWWLAVSEINHPVNSYIRKDDKRFIFC